jgi:probable phosphoglycerate mutase
VEEVASRADRAIARAGEVEGDVALFAHGHLLRVLAARWIGLPGGGGGSLALDTASMSILGLERDRRVIRLWNEVRHQEGRS